MLAWTTDKSDPQYDYCQKAYRALKKQTDAKGREFIIHKMKLPSPLYLGKEEAKSLFIILPAFGVKEDEAALKTMQKVYPDKEIHQVNTLEILYGGGNIHCITMQVPTKEDKE